MTDNRPTILYGANSEFAFRTFLAEHLRFFAVRGYRIITVLPKQERTGCGSSGSDSGVEEYRVTLRREISPAIDVISLIQLWRRIRKARPAIVNMTTPKMGLLGTLAAVLAGVPVRVYTLRGLRLETTHGFKRILLTWAERLACQWSTVVVCISSSLRERAIELGVVDASKAVVISGRISEGIPLTTYALTPDGQTAAAALRARLGIAASAYVLGFVGRLTRDKGVCELVTAFRAVKSRHKDLKLVLVGEFEAGNSVPDSLREEILQDPDIFWLGYLPHPADVFHMIDVLVLPTYREGLGRVLIEAAAAGKPVISTHTTGVVDVVRDGVTGLLVPPQDAPALAEAIDRLASDHEYSRRLGQAALDLALAEFEGESRLSELEGQYTEWLDHATRGRLLPKTAPSQADVS
jgi:glycosyltransferase involved in cell wall biosynthesis